jgi:tetratricopeptide (TPR) repeat protein
MKTAPEEASFYDNIGVNYESLKEYETAMDWYFKACEYDHKHKKAHFNVSNMFDMLNFTYFDIIIAMRKYPKLDPFMFYYYLGLAYFNKKQNYKSLEWYKMAEGIDSMNFGLMNAIALNYN